LTTYKSGFERTFAKQFKLPYETTRLAYVVTHHYTPDWTVGPTRFIETKGLWTGADRQKHLYIKKQHPHIEVLLVFQDPNRRLSKASKVTYSAWCEKHGLPWASATDLSAITAWVHK
jgi:hypothetical protein